MAFSPACLPSLPTCPSDFAAWAEDLVVCLTTNFQSAFDEINAISVPPVNICDEIGSLGPGCYLNHQGIDQTGFYYASSDDEVIAGNGLLPPIPALDVFEHRAGIEMINSGTCANKGTKRIVFENPMSTSNYAVFLTLGSDYMVYCFAPKDNRTAASFDIVVSPHDCDTGENKNTWVYWFVIRIS